MNESLRKAIINCFQNPEPVRIDLIPHEVVRQLQSMPIAEKVTLTNQLFHERRRFPRVPTRCSALAIELNNASEPIGSPFEIILMCISSGGLNFAHPRNWQGKTLAIQLGWTVGFSELVYAIGPCVRSESNPLSFVHGHRFDVLLKPGMQDLTSPSENMLVMKPPMAEFWESLAPSTFSPKSDPFLS